MRPPACVANKTAGAKVLFAASLVPNGTGVTWTKQNKRQIGNPKHNVRLPSYFQLGGPPLCLPSNKFGPIERQTGAHNKSAKFEGRNQGRSIKLAPFSAPFATPVPVCKLMNQFACGQTFCPLSLELLVASAPRFPAP